MIVAASAAVTGAFSRKSVSIRASSRRRSSAEARLGQQAGADQLGPRVGGDPLARARVAHVPRLGLAMGAAGIGDDVGADVPGHHDGDPDLWRVGAQVFDQRLGEAFDGELGCGVGVFGIPGPRLAQNPFTLLVLISTPSPLAINSGRNVRAQ